MRRKRNVQPETFPQQNLDSFLDILMNVVGTLMFIGLFVSLATVLNASKIKRLPRSQNTNKNRYLFEIRDRKIINLEADFKTANRQINNFFYYLPTCYRFDWYCSRRKLMAFRNFTVRTSHYTVSLQIQGIIFTPLISESGETEQQISSESSNFQQTLKKLNPETDFLYFLVRSDSFDTFEKVWNLVEEEKFAVGWNPIANKNEPIIFSQDGRPIDCQSGGC